VGWLLCVSSLDFPILEIEMRGLDLDWMSDGVWSIGYGVYIDLEALDWLVGGL